MDLIQQSCGYDFKGYSKRWDRLAKAKAKMDDAERELFAAVEFARSGDSPVDGALSWSQVAAVLGVTKQAAHKRFTEVV